MGTVYRIVNWDEHFENHRTRQMASIRYVLVPNKFDGDRITDLIEQGGDAIYGAWCAIVLVASRCKPRGTLIRDNGKAHNTKSLARMTGISEASIEKCLSLGTSVGLLQTVTLEGESDRLAREVDIDAPHINGDKKDKEEEGVKKEKEKEGTCVPSGEDADSVPPDSILTFPVKGKVKLWHFTQSRADEYADLFPGLDVLVEMRKARQWCIDNPPKRKTATGMGQFCTRWLTRANDRPGRPEYAPPPESSVPQSPPREVLASFLQDNDE